jgi:hypothetical protein
MEMMVVMDLRMETVEVAVAALEDLDHLVIVLVVQVVVVLVNHFQLSLLQY